MLARNHAASRVLLVDEERLAVGRLCRSSFGDGAAAQVRRGEHGGVVAHLQLPDVGAGWHERVDLVEDVVGKG